MWTHTMYTNPMEHLGMSFFKDPPENGEGFAINIFEDFVIPSSKTKRHFLES